MASGVALCLYRAGLRRVLMLEVPQPLAVRRTVSFCEAVHNGCQQVENVSARLAYTPGEIEQAWAQGEMAVAPDPAWELIKAMSPRLVIDATLAKRNLGTRQDEAPLVIALGPGFTAGVDAHLVVETQRGHNLGRVYKKGSAEPNTGIPGPVEGYTTERVLRAPCSGTVQAAHALGDSVKKGEVICSVDGQEVYASISGVLRGLIRPEVWVEKGLKIGDIDPRGQAEYCWSISEKARSIGNAVLGNVCGTLAEEAFARLHRADELWQPGRPAL